MAETIKQRSARLQKLIDATHRRGVALHRLLTALTRLNARRRAELHALQGITPVRVRFGLDWAWTNTSPQNMIRAMHSVGATFACRYLSHDPGKNLTPQESGLLKAGGIFKVVVWETTADRATQGFAAGAADAKQALAQGRACGMPKNRPIYFAVDFDANGPEVVEYFKGVISVLGLARTGAYAGFRCIRFLFNNKLISWGWQTYAWSTNPVGVVQWDPRAQLHQYSNSHTVGGTDCDYNRSVAVDFGQW